MPSLALILVTMVPLQSVASPAFACLLHSWWKSDLLNLLWEQGASSVGGRVRAHQQSLCCVCWSSAVSSCPQLWGLRVLLLSLSCSLLAESTVPMRRGLVCNLLTGLCPPAGCVLGVWPSQEFLSLLQEKTSPLIPSLATVSLIEVLSPVDCTFYFFYFSSPGGKRFPCLRKVSLPPGIQWTWSGRVILCLFPSAPTLPEPQGHTSFSQLGWLAPRAGAHQCH